MMFISYLGSEKFGGINVIPYGWDMLIITCLSLVFYGWAVKNGFKTEYLEEATKVNEEVRLRERTIESQLDKEKAI